MKDTLLLVLVLSACASSQGVPSTAGPSAALDAASPADQEVAEIDPRIWCIHQARNGDLWFGSNGNGVYRYDGQQVTHYTRADGLSGHQVRDIEDDKKGDVLVSTTDGVTRFDGRTWTELEVEAPLGAGGWVLDPDDVWIVVVPGNGGPGRYDGEKLYRLALSKSPAEDAHRARYPDANFPPDGVYGIYEDRRGHLWFGTASVGLCRYDGETLSWMYEERLTTTPSGGAFGIRSVYEDRAGAFWVCNTRQRFEISSGATLEDGYTRINYEKREGLPDAQSDADKNFTYYSSMTEDAAGSLWMACGSGGVWRYDGDHITRFPIDDGAYTISILCDREGTLWVGTLENGIYTLEGASFEPFNPDEPRK